MEDKKEEKEIKEEDNNAKKSIKKKHGFFYWLIVILGVTFIMILSVNIGQSLIKDYRKSKNENKDKTDEKNTVENYNYSNFLQNKTYLKDTKEWENKPYSYYLYDINKDGIDELFVVSFEGKDTEFFNTAIYTYKDNEVKLVANLYTYLNVYGYKDGEGVVFATQKTSSINYYVLYKMVDGKLETVPDVSFETGDSRLVIKELIKLP